MELFECLCEHESHQRTRGANHAYGVQLPKIDLGGVAAEVGQICRDCAGTHYVNPIHEAWIKVDK